MHLKFMFTRRADLATKTSVFGLYEIELTLLEFRKHHTTGETANHSYYLTKQARTVY
jgi:hypothetical protein